MRLLKPIYLSATLALALTSCGGAKLTTSHQAITDVNNLPKKSTALSETQLQRWSHLDILKDTVPGMSVDRAYEELLKNRKTPKKVIVGVIDSGIEIDHDDLKNHIWVNPKEKASNGIDDDKNGYIDDIHGWNFLGKSNHENLEFVRIIKRGDDGSEQYQRALKKHKEELAELNMNRERILATMPFEQHEILAKHFAKQDYTVEDLDSITDSASDELLNAKEDMYSLIESGNFTRLLGYKDYLDSQLNYHLNVDYNGRDVVGDDHTDINDRIYGDNDVLGDREHAKHGTHVAGIIAQSRHNNLGGDGVASEVTEIMALRAVPDGDEYDKDIALSIRYAADNGAKVINGSFGKYFEENSQWVRDAIKYAEEKDVLIVVAAGNDATDLNANGGVERYPNDNTNMGPEISNNFLVVGALNPEFSTNMVASFSNYGNYDVDVFAPGSKIYATVPNNTYEYLQGTSMASPNVAGVAALIRAYYPEFTAGEVKKIIMDSGVPVNKEVKVGNETRNFSDISTSGKFVNAYNALILADKLSKKK